MKYCELTRQSDGSGTSTCDGAGHSQLVADGEMVCSSAPQECNLPLQVPCVPHTLRIATHPLVLPAMVASHTPDGKQLNMSRSTKGRQDGGRLCSGHHKQPLLLT